MNARHARAYVGLGSNLDDPAAQLRRAFDELAALDGVHGLRRSRLFRTPPWGRLDQPHFVNAVAELDTTLSPRPLLDRLQALEARFGRARRERWGPRVLDLDLLLHGDAVLDEDGLHVPHPRLHERAFVLVPLAELAPGLVVPGRGAVSSLLAGVDATGIEALG
jgi:2-amino-4-hydroxy-6-hydroxymethyldihydropteridine diphosphokinase